MADDLAHQKALLVQSLKTASDYLLDAMQDIATSGTCEPAKVASAIKSTELALAVGREHLKAYEEFLDIAAIMTGNNASRLLTDLLARRANG